MASPSKEALKLAGTMLAISAALAGLLYWSTSVEQARSPGEKSLGVAALGMLFGIPMLLAAASGAAGVLVSIALAAHQRLRTRGTRKERNA